MALKKIKTFTNGTSGEYWIAEPHINKSDNTTTIYLLLYKDQAVRDAGGSCMLRDNAGIMDGVYKTGEEIYAWLKRSIPSGGEGTEGEEGYVDSVETNWFADSEDI